MTSHYRHQRTANPATAFPSPIEPGEIAVNTANRQIAVGDANASGIGNPLALLGVRVFDARGIYAVGDYVVQAGSLYRCTAANGPGAFVAAKWVSIADKTYVDAGDAAATAHADAGDASITTAFQNADASITTAYQSADASITTAFQNADASITTAYQSADASINALKAPIASPLFTGDPRAPTPVPGDSDTSIATTAFVNAALAGAVVRYDVTQALTAAQQQQARQNIYAAPFDAMAYNGMQINGGFEVSQENGTSVITSTGTSFTRYLCDGWQLFKSAATAQVNIAVAANTTTFPNMLNFIYLVPATPQAALAASDLVEFFQYIEGFRVGHLGWGTAGAQPITIAFSTCHHRVGTYSVAVSNGTRSYAATYTQNVADTSEYKTATIPGDTAGTWFSDNRLGLQISFAVASGSNATAPAANTWYGTSYAAAPGQVNAVAAATDAFRITGVIVLPGIEAPNSARASLIMRPYDQELVMCRRYFYNGVPPLRGYVGATNIASYMGAAHPVKMRAVPTLVLTANIPICDGSAFTTLASIKTSYSTQDVLEGDFYSAAATLSPSHVLVVCQGGGGNINVDARL